MAELPSLGAELRAIAREAVKDIRGMVNQVFFGAQDGPGEPGTPMVPTQMEVTQARGTVHGFNAQQEGAIEKPGLNLEELRAAGRESMERDGQDRERGGPER